MVTRELASVPRGQGVPVYLINADRVARDSARLWLCAEVKLVTVEDAEVFA